MRSANKGMGMGIRAAFLNLDTHPYIARLGSKGLELVRLLNEYGLAVLDSVLLPLAGSEDGLLGHVGHPAHRQGADGRGRRCDAGEASDQDHSFSQSQYFLQSELRV